MKETKNYTIIVTYPKEDRYGVPFGSYTETHNLNVTEEQLKQVLNNIKNGYPKPIKVDVR